jgi:predicted ribonuclease YlaK
MNKFYDTCALLELQEKAFEDFFYIADVTLVELENIKTSASKDNEIKYKARKLLHLLDNKSSQYEVVKTGANATNNDNDIINAALSLQKENDETLFVTKDVACRRLAAAAGLNTINPDIEEDDYTGYKIINLDDEELAIFYSSEVNSKNNKYGLLINEYLIVINNSCIVDKYKWTEEGYKKVVYPKIDSKFFGKISPYNNDAYQLLALDSLVHDQMVVLRGPAGSGKSYLAFAHMMNQLETGKKEKIIIFCNTVAARGAAKLGFYPGTRTEKLLDSQIGNFLKAKLGEDIVNDMILHEQLILLPLADIRGYDTSGSNSIIYITEAQNMDSDLMKLALQRVGDDCQVILDGDDNAQVDLDMYAGEHNGLRRVSKVFRGQDFYSEVTLKNIYRSKIAKIAENL